MSSTRSGREVRADAASESLCAGHRDLLEKLARVLVPLDAKINHSLHVGTAEQMRADLSYLRGLLAEARSAIESALMSRSNASHFDPDHGWSPGSADKPRGWCVSSTTGRVSEPGKERRDSHLRRDEA